MSKVHVHPTTNTQLRSIEQSPPHALLLFGPEGVGLRTIAWDLAVNITKEAYVSEVVPDEKGTITIETVRSLYRQTRTKQQVFRVVIIDDADAMSHAAQNALLKLLEEPVSNMVFILTSHRPTALLPTIASRLQHVDVRPVPAEITLQIITKATVGPQLAAQLGFMAGGLPAELLRLLGDESYRLAKIEIAEKAKSFIADSRSSKLVLIAKIASSRSDAQLFVAMLMRMLQVQLKRQQDEKLLNYIDTLISVSNILENNGHVRTQLLRTVV
jgi:DNA polymerase III delta prime subunit